MRQTFLFVAVTCLSSWASAICLSDGTCLNDPSITRDTASASNTDASVLPGLGAGLVDCTAQANSIPCVYNPVTGQATMTFQPTAGTAPMSMQVNCPGGSISSCPELARQADLIRKTFSPSPRDSTANNDRAPASPKEEEEEKPKEQAQQPQPPGSGSGQPPGQQQQQPQQQQQQPQQQAQAGSGASCEAKPPEKSEGESSSCEKAQEVFAACQKSEEFAQATCNPECDKGLMAQNLRNILSGQRIGQAGAAAQSTAVDSGVQGLGTSDSIGQFAGNCKAGHNACSNEKKEGKCDKAKQKLEAMLSKCTKQKQQIQDLVKQADEKIKSCQQALAQKSSQAAAQAAENNNSGQNAAQNGAQNGAQGAGMGDMLSKMMEMMKQQQQQDKKKEEEEEQVAAQPEAIDCNSPAHSATANCNLSPVGSAALPAWSPSNDNRVPASVPAGEALPEGVTPP